MLQLERKKAEERKRERETRFPLDPDIGSIQGINFPRLHRVTRRFDELTFPAIPTSAGAYRSRRKNEQDRNWEELLHLGHFEYTLPKTLRVSSRYIHGKCCCLRVSRRKKYVKAVAFCRRLRFFRGREGCPREEGTSLKKEGRVV